MRDANCHDHVGVGQGASVSVRVCESVAGVFMWLSAHLSRGGYFEMFNILDGYSECSTFGVIFPLIPLLCSLYLPWDPLPSLESTPVAI